MRSRDQHAYRAASARMTADVYGPLHQDMDGGFGLGLALVWVMFAFLPLSAGYATLTMIGTAVFLVALAVMSLLAGKERRSWGDPASLSWGDKLIDGSGKLVIWAAVALTVAALT